MAEQTKRTVRKGFIYHLKVADTNYRAFIWQVGKSFFGRIEDQTQVEECRGPSVVAVQARLRAALAASAATKSGS
jgi:hypothetical protein